MESSTVLELKNVTKKLGNKNVVDDLSFSIQSGEVFGLLGPNGAGKTTTIRMIAGLISKSNGKVFINGVDADENFKQVMSEMGAIVENPEMYKFLTGYQNLLHFARMAQVSITKERIQEVIKLVDLEKNIHRKVKTYSLGMRQRLGVAQAILHKPSLLIFDEPTNGLDPQGIYEFRTYLKKLTEQGVAVMVSSHLLAEMQQMCDRVAIIQEGKLIDISSVHELREDHDADTLVQFEVDQPELAKEKLTDFEFDIVDGYLQCATQRRDIPSINSKLVQANIQVFGISSKNPSLEEKFLAITKGGEEA
ncbi:ABC transporter ATP-binding protein [Virgibacillus sp. MSP4-1]|uniref:ABC transporter ATP-binding protein n=1 Tax=Virgibacillus sp. MSP4-1 TaxID=2700081 RepID=UPI00039FBDF6|nr:ABC transporter ATP-binding protein [Virgibacillus sp. MSP4-1]QHS21522.1 ABC transporter ATP-binding protein [Virgibacillus sp. MSP4-1]